nr:Activating signal cointegrator 1 complex subunit [Hymenolepis microstoma]
MIDLAALYCSKQPDIVKSIFASVFKENSKFVDDAVSTMECAVEALKVVEKNVAAWQFDEKHQFVTANSDSMDVVSETIEYVVDASCSLGTFLSFIAPVNSSVASLCIRKGIVSSLADFYDSTIVNIRDHILRCLTWSTEKKSELLHRLAIAGASLVKTVRVGLIEPGLVNRIMQLAFGGDSNESKSQTLSAIFGIFIDVMIEMTNHTGFAGAYTYLYPVGDDINLVREAASSASVDHEQLDYLQSAFSRLCDESNAKQANSATKGKAREEKEETMQPGPSTSTSTKVEEQPPQPCCSRPPEFRTIKSVFPDIESDVIERCLEHYNNDTEAIISALLDGSIPLSITNPELIKQSTPSFKPGQIWLGKQQKAASLEPLSKEDKERVANLAVSVWDDEEAIGGYNYGDNDDDGRERAQVKWENEHQFATGRGEDLTYLDEYDDTFDGEIGVDVERAEEEVEEAESANNQVFYQPPPPSAPPSFPRGSMRGVHKKHRYRQDLSSAGHVPEQQHRQNVLQIENPEELRQRKQYFASQKAIRKGVVNIQPRMDIPVQPAIPEIPGSEPQEPQPYASKPTQPHKVKDKDGSNLGGELLNQHPARDPIKSVSPIINQNRRRKNSGGGRGRDGRPFSNQPSLTDKHETDHPYRGEYNRGSRSFNRGGNRGRGSFSVGRVRGRTAANGGHDSDIQRTGYRPEDDSYSGRLKERYGSHN